MARRRLYVPLAVAYFDDPKIIEACERSPWNEILFTRALTIAKDSERDGLVTRVDLIRARVPKLEARIKDLVDVGILRAVDGGWVFAAWLRHNLTNEQIEAKRRIEAERQARLRNKQTGGDVANESDTDQPHETPPVTRDTPPGVTRNKHRDLLAGSLKLEAGSSDVVTLRENSTGVGPNLAPPAHSPTHRPTGNARAQLLAAGGGS